MKKNNLKKGFTLIEALVAVSILMVAVAAPITIAQKGLSSAVYSKDQMIASYLAQDALEYVINQRDQASINSPTSDWGAFRQVLGVCEGEYGCEIDTVRSSFDNTHVQSASVSGENIKILKDNGGKFQFYGYEDGGTETKFKRNIKIDLRDVNGTGGATRNEALVTVDVTWPGDKNHVTIHSLIYNR
ncbi:MAG: prepilin-type N-terminal cleavage/methylation domain-containing protein [Candidatus Paceibacterota bacterium]